MVGRRGYQGWWPRSDAIDTVDGMVFGNSMFQAGLYTDDEPDYWTVLDAQHGRYSRALRFLVVTTMVLLVLALIIHPAVAGLALALLPIIGIHLVLVRHSRSCVRIPDYRTGGSGASEIPKS